MVQTAIPFMQLRGGSSKGVYFRKSDLPAGPVLREAVLKWVMGAYGDPRQIDGLGGAHPLTSKLAVVSPSAHQGCDVDYQFIQAMVGEDRLDDSPNCGNILAGVGAFALESGMLSVAGEQADITVFMTNSQKKCNLAFSVEDGRPVYQGDAEINGVLGTAAPVMCHYHELAGSLCGALMPTGSLTDEIDGVRVTCIDNGMPVVCLRAADFGLSGQETPDELNANDELKERLDIIRCQAGHAMGLGDVTDKSVPKMCLVSSPAKSGHLCTRTFIPTVCHQAIGVLGAVSVATAALFEGSAIHDLADIPEGYVKSMRVEHPSGHLDVQLELNPYRPDIDILRAGLLRTTRLISKGEVFIPASVWEGHAKA
ncbi:hypothetical protein HIMB100_00003350 [SAR116 cluster alpha proteobacterium HIMB100]|nr:hypothetical protein HIMB100_00003350 [SAR116 cluster alpha proteobacterium HIMB100]